MQFIARLEFELDYLGSTHKRASLEIFKLDSARLDYIPNPLNRLDIPTVDYCKFQLFAALVMDLIWQSRNKLIHDGILPNLALAIQQLKVTLQSHYLA
jgi:hypothetical protein